MGCCPSACVKKQRSANVSLTHDTLYASPTAGSTLPQRSASKRSYTSRISNGSGSGSSSSASSPSTTATSGVSSAYTTPTRRSILSRCNSNTSAQLPKPKPNKSNYPTTMTSMMMMTMTASPTSTKSNGTGYDMHSICDDFCEAAEQQQQEQQQSQQQQQQLDKSFGYYTESSRASTPSKSCMRRTQDHSQSYNCSSTTSTSTPTPPVISDLEMEMYMMAHAQCLMPKTSSPISQRRDRTFDVLDDHCQFGPPMATLQTTSKSYHKWRTYLQATPAYMLHNVTHIPEAVAGQFCPADFPAFSDLEEMDSAAKRYKVDVPAAAATTTTTAATPAYALHFDMAAMGLTHTISTDL